MSFIPDLKERGFHGLKPNNRKGTVRIGSRIVQ
jgi:hypothetical protein